MNNMRYITYTILSFFVGCVTASSVYAQETQTITVGPDRVMYTETRNDVENAISYYNGEGLVMTAYDEDGSRTPDVWVMYRDDMSILREMRDSNSDGEPDIFFDIDRDENLQRAGGDGMAKYATSTTEEPEGSLDDVDYAGDLENIQELAGESDGSIVWILLALAIGGAFIWWKKKK
jgi:hypothetical protein